MQPVALVLILAFATSSTSAYKLETRDGERQARSYEQCTQAAVDQLNQNNNNPCIYWKCIGGLTNQVMRNCPKVEDLIKDQCPVPTKTASECCKRCKCVDHLGTSYNEGDKFVYGTSSSTYDCECINDTAMCKERDSGNKFPGTTTQPMPTWDWNWDWDSPN